MRLVPACALHLSSPYVCLQMSIQPQPHSRPAQVYYSHVYPLAPPGLILLHSITHVSVDEVAPQSRARFSLFAGPQHATKRSVCDAKHDRTSGEAMSHLIQNHNSNRLDSFLKIPSLNGHGTLSPPHKM